MLAVYIYTAFLNQQSNNITQCLVNTLIAVLLSIFDFFTQSFYKS